MSHAIRDLAQALKAGRPDAQLRFRFGTCSSIETDRTCTVTFAGDDTPLPGTRYGVLPLPGAGVILATDGSDLFVHTVLAAAGRSLAPRAGRTSDQVVSDATDTAVTFQAVDSDEWECWSAGNPTRLTAPATGRYLLQGTASFAASSAGVRSAWLAVNGAEVARTRAVPPTGEPADLTVHSAPLSLTKGDYTELWVRQSSGGSLNLVHASPFSPALGLVYLGP